MYVLYWALTLGTIIIVSPLVFHYAGVLGRVHGARAAGRRRTRRKIALESAYGRIDSRQVPYRVSNPPAPPLWGYTNDQLIAELMRRARDAQRSTPYDVDAPATTFTNLKAVSDFLKHLEAERGLRP